MACISIVLPERGEATIRPRWPWPMGVIRSSTRAESLSAPFSSLIQRFGLIVVSSSKGSWSRYKIDGPLVDLLQLDQLRAAAVGNAHAGELHAVAQAVALDHVRRHKDVLRRRRAAPLGFAQKAVTFIVNF